VFIWPVSDIFSSPDAKSQNFIVLSAEPEAKNWLHGEMAKALTQPWWPTMTLYNLYGACHVGLINFLIEFARIVPSFVAYTKFIYNLLLTTNEFYVFFYCLASFTLLSYFSNVFILCFASYELYFISFIIS
jgi:hypothetical protein